MEEYSNWIWTKSWGAEEDKSPGMVLFRKSIDLKAEAEQADIKISADSRYKLYINNRFVEAGPSKGDGQVWFYDQISIKPYLKTGENVLAVMVLRFPMKPSESNQSILGTFIPGLFLTGSVKDKEGTIYDISADETWKCCIDRRTRFIREASGFSPLHFYEEVTETESMKGWKDIRYQDIKWEQAVPYPRAAIRDAVSPGNLNPRTIPYMKRKIGRFTEVMAVRQSHTEKEKWNQMLSGNGTVEIEANTEEIVEIHAGEEMTGYLKIMLEQGAGARIQLLQAESYVQRQGTQSLKTDRMDSEGGILEGYEDCYRPAGYGTEDNPEEYEPFWFRTFRFIQLKIVTKDKPLKIRDFFFEETGYPLNVNVWAKTSDASLESIWNISERTLKRCMHETYMDCPFYEQLQYVMDSRAQILFTYAVSMDDRLARKCIDDFKRAQRYDGLLCSAYPNTRPNVIPGFSIFYIWMLHDHMMYFGDKEWIRFHMPAVEEVLNFFERNKTEQGYIGKVGGFYRQHKFWSFIDWAPQWKVGVPNAAEAGALTMENLLYLLGLKMGSELAEFISRTELAEEYKKKAQSLKDSIKKYCMNSEGWLMDGPGYEEYSQHCQVFGILSGVLDKDTGKRNLLKTLRDREQYAQCTVSMALYLFRALEMVDAYEETENCWDIWREMVKNHMTTVAESDVSPRSDCHAWGALALYELPCTVLGIRPAAPGFEKIQVSPFPGYLTWARGEGLVADGKIYVEWSRDKEQELCITVKAKTEVMRKIIKQGGIEYVEE